MKSIRWLILIHLVFCVFLTTSNALAKSPYGIWSAGFGSYYPPYVLTVDKSKRKLQVWRANNNEFKLVKEYDSDQGEVEGDKQVLGDKKTPEGIYFFEEQMDGRRVNYDKYGKRIFTMNYPNLFDSRAGKTGYGIWLHAIPDSVPLDRGSEGCVVLRNESIIDVSEYIYLNKTPIIVYDEMKIVDEKKREARMQELKSFLVSWHSSWESKEIDRYMSHYSPSFYSSRRNKEQWKNHKTNLNKIYQSIEVNFSDPVIYEHNGQIVVRNLQHYRSDQYEDFGEKFLYIERDKGVLKIIAEEWKAVPQHIVRAEIGNSNFIARDLSSLEPKN